MNFPNPAKRFCDNKAFFGYWRFFDGKITKKNNFCQKIYSEKGGKNCTMTNKKFFGTSFGL